MKKYVIAILMLVLLLGGCATKPAEQSAATTELTNMPTTAPTTTVPTTAPTAVLATEPATVPTTAPTTAPPFIPTTPTKPTVERPYNKSVLFFIYRGERPLYMDAGADMSKCKENHLYVYDKELNRIDIVFDGSVSALDIHNESIFFVKSAEPTNLYAARTNNFAEHTVIYKSNHGSIVDLILPDVELYDKAITILEDNTRFVYLDLVTMEAEVLLEQPFIRLIYIDDVKKDRTKPAESWKDFTRIYFEGSLVEGGEVKQYLYFWETGKIEENFRL